MGASLVAQLVKTACNTEDPSFIPGSGRSTREGIGYPLQYSWASLVAQLVKNLPAMRRPGIDSWVGKIPQRRVWPLIAVFWPGEFHGLYGSWGCKELQMTEQLSLSFSSILWHIKVNIMPVCSTSTWKSHWIYLFCQVKR